MNAFTTNPRKSLTPQKRAKLFLDRGGICHKCTRRLRPGDSWIVEHVQALQNGGDNEWDNLAITCSWCKPDKDREDHKIAAKGRHVATKHVVPGSELRKSKGSFRKPQAPEGYRYNPWTRRMEEE